MTILVTGASGFLGRFLCKKLEKNNKKVIKLNSKNCDLTKAFSLDQFNSVHFDYIFHLAAWTQAGDFCLKYPGQQWINNQMINTNILSWWANYQPQAKIICMGTSCGYDPMLPHLEENYLKGTPIDSLLTYGMTKRMLLYGLLALEKQYQLRYLYFIPSTLYGADYHTDGRQLHFIFDLIRKILRGKLVNEDVVLWGDGYQKRELVHVEDFVETMLNFIELKENEVINIGAGKEYSIRDFAHMISKKVGYNFEDIQYDVDKYVGAKSKVLKIDKLLTFLPQYSSRNINEGLNEVIDWFIENKELFI